MNNINRTNFLPKYGIYIAFLFLISFMAIVSPPFLSGSNILNILRQTSINGIIAVGMTFVIIAGGIDLSVGSILALTAVVAASLAHPGINTINLPSFFPSIGLPPKIEYQYNLTIPIIVGLSVGTFCGFLNGFIISYRKIAPFIVTLGMMTIARGGALLYTKGRPVIELGDSYNAIGGEYILGLPIPVIIFMIVSIIAIVIIKYSRFGRYVYAIGGNELAASFSGINIKKNIIAIYSIAGFMSGLAGIVLSSRVMSASPSLGESYELDAIAAVVIGGTSLSGGIGSIQKTIIGVLIIGAMNNGLDLLNVSSYLQMVIKGVIIIGAVILDKKSNN